LTTRLPLSVTSRAAREIRETSAWWDVHRSAAPNAFREAIATAFELIATQPRIGAVATNTRLRNVRRLHLAEVHYHLYYRVQPHAVEVLALWHTSRFPDPAL
ncbi:MAG: type II toxin-antitoxin system RelE/ParE family toxin, partial [Acidobacteria bacterium]|nr:type II toxin-antitoxin system RelE/ParE family toxin [Acidobacteriota bacterium]